MIYWSVLGTAGDRSKMEHALEGARLYVQRRVAEGLRTRVAPQLTFVYDESVEGAIKMGGLLKQLRADRGDPEPDPAAAAAAASEAPSDASDATDEDDSDSEDENDENDEDDDEGEGDEGDSSADDDGDGEAESADDPPPRSR